MAVIDVKEFLKITPQLINLPVKRIWYSYDQEADVLYLNFKFSVMVKNIVKYFSQSAWHIHWVTALS